MKTIIHLSFVCTTLTLFSCQKKEYTCRCGGGINGLGTTKKIESMNISRAKKVCDNMSTPDYVIDGFHGCELK